MPEPIVFPRRIIVGGAWIDVSSEAHLTQQKTRFAREVQFLQQQRQADPASADLLKKLLVNVSFLEKLVEIEEQLLEVQHQQWLAENEELDRQIKELITPILQAGDQPRS